MSSGTRPRRKSLRISPPINPRRVMPDGTEMQLESAPRQRTKSAVVASMKDSSSLSKRTTPPPPLILKNTTSASATSSHVLPSHSQASTLKPPPFTAPLRSKSQELFLIDCHLDEDAPPGTGKSWGLFGKRSNRHLYSYSKSSTSLCSTPPTSPPLPTPSSSSLSLRDSKKQAYEPFQHVLASYPQIHSPARSQLQAPNNQPLYSPSFASLSSLSLSPDAYTDQFYVNIPDIEADPTLRHLDPKDWGKVHAFFAPPPVIKPQPSSSQLHLPLHQQGQQQQRHQHPYQSQRQRQHHQQHQPQVRVRAQDKVQTQSPHTAGHETPKVHPKDLSSTADTGSSMSWRKGQPSDQIGDEPRPVASPGLISHFEPQIQQAPPPARLQRRKASKRSNRHVHVIQRRGSYSAFSIDGRGEEALDEDSKALSLISTSSASTRFTRDARGPSPFASLDSSSVSSMSVDEHEDLDSLVDRPGVCDGGGGGGGDGVQTGDGQRHDGGGSVKAIEASRHYDQDDERQHTVRKDDRDPARESAMYFTFDPEWEPGQGDADIQLIPPPPPLSSPSPFPPSQSVASASALASAPPPTSTGTSVRKRKSEWSLRRNRGSPRFHDPFPLEVLALASFDDSENDNGDKDGDNNDEDDDDDDDNDFLRKGYLSEYCSDDIDRIIKSILGHVLTDAGGPSVVESSGRDESL
ncbi:hypothetical protein AX16_010194 [Volvariella volvacea WC 439]|nr:hypothetical protein AX16_010194 [Volvariella volvacea WC 439]